MREEGEGESREEGWWWWLKETDNLIPATSELQDEGTPLTRVGGAGARGASCWPTRKPRLKPG